jgi:type VI secretion system protein
MRRSLFERALDGQLGVRVEDDDLVRQSIVASLRRLFGTFQGDASIDPGYGLPDIIGICRNLPEATEQMRVAIVTAIQKYEPRLRRVRVTPKPDADGRILRFEIRAELNHDAAVADHPFRAATRLQTSGHLVVEE